MNVDILMLLFASLVVDEVNYYDDHGQNAEADRQRYSGVHPNVDSFVRAYT